MAEAPSIRLASSLGDDGLGGKAPRSRGSCATRSKIRSFTCVQISSVFVFGSALVLVHSAQNFPEPYWTPLHQLQFETGDLISCKLAQKFRALGSFYAPGLEHWLLAYNSRHLVDIEPNGALTETFVAIQPVNRINHYQECYKLGNEKLAPNIVRGLVDVVKGRTLYYNLLRCNCKHYTLYWATGKKGGSLGRVSFLPPSRKCAYVLEVNTPPFINRDTLIPAIPAKEQPQNAQPNPSLVPQAQQDTSLVPLNKQQIATLLQQNVLQNPGAQNFQPNFPPMPQGIQQELSLRPQRIQQTPSLMTQSSQQNPFLTYQGLQQSPYPTSQGPQQNPYLMTQGGQQGPTLTPQNSFQTMPTSPLPQNTLQTMPTSPLPQSFQQSYPVQFYDQSQNSRSFSGMPQQDQTPNFQQNFPGATSQGQLQQFQQPVPLLSLLPPRDRKQIQQHYPELPPMHVMPGQIR